MDICFDFDFRTKCAINNSGLIVLRFYYLFPNMTRTAAAGRLIWPWLNFSINQSISEMGRHRQAKLTVYIFVMMCLFECMYLCDICIVHCTIHLYYNLDILFYFPFLENLTHSSKCVTNWGLCICCIEIDSGSPAGHFPSYLRLYVQYSPKRKAIFEI